MNKYIFLLITIFFFAANGFSEEKKQVVKKGPITISSQEMTSYNNGAKIVFSGNVVTKRDSLTIYSDILDVYSNDKKDKVVKIVATGTTRNVQIEKEGKRAEGKKAIYREEEGIIELIGDVKAWEKENIITGEKMLFYVNEDIIKVFGEKDKKVHVTFYPDEKKESESGESGTKNKESE